MPTIQSALAEAHSLLTNISESPLLDAEILLCKVIEKDRAYLRTWPERELSDVEYQGFIALTNKRQQGQPIAYLNGVKEFWSREFLVTPDVLIPRPETELLIELCLQLIPPNKPCKILDLGTGSGIIAITLAAERPNALVSATDISPAALQVAKANAAKHKVRNIQFYQSDWFANMPTNKFDLIVSNPPYVAKDDPHLQEGDLRFEPKTALVSAKHGLNDIHNITVTAFNRLQQGGFLLLEHGYNQQKVLQTCFSSLGYQHIKTEKDLAGQPRVTYGQFLRLKLPSFVRPAGED